MRFTGEAIRFTLNFDDGRDYWEVMRNVAEAQLDHEAFQAGVMDLLAETLKELPTLTTHGPFTHN